MKFLFDLGGVFFNWDPEFFYKSIFKSRKEMEYFLNNICNDDWNKKQDEGRLIIDAEKELILAHPKYTKEIKLYYQNHRKMIKGVFHETIKEFMKIKSKNYLCYVLSNWSSETYDGMEEEYPFLKKFDDKIISGDYSLSKPDKKIFELAISKFRLIPEKTVFIDDKLENISATKKLNFITIHLNDPKKIQYKIKKIIKL